jgi:hypothetical protein
MCNVFLFFNPYNASRAQNGKIKGNPNTKQYQLHVNNEIDGRSYMLFRHQTQITKET